MNVYNHYHNGSNVIKHQNYSINLGIYWIFTLISSVVFKGGSPHLEKKFLKSVESYLIMIKSMMHFKYLREIA